MSWGLHDVANIQDQQHMEKGSDSPSLSSEELQNCCIYSFLHHVTCAVANLHCMKMQFAQSIQYIRANKNIFLQLALDKGACLAFSSITFHYSGGSGRKPKRKSPMAILVS